jgi:hypothetical protein
MNMASLDEGVGNLERLCGLLAQANGSLKDQTTRAEADADAVQVLEDRCDRELDRLGDELETLQDTAKSDSQEGASAVEGLGTLARTVADERLVAVDHDLGDAQAAAQQRLDESETSLESGFGELTSAGFEALASALDAVEGGVQGSAETAASIEETGAGCESGWSDELPADLESQCSAASDGVAGAYAGFGSEGLGEGEALLDRVSSLGGGASDFLLNEESGQVETAGAAAAEQAFPELLAELAGVQATLEAVSQAAAALEPMVGELEIAKEAVGQVAELLAAIGG